MYVQKDDNNIEAFKFVVILFAAVIVLSTLITLGTNMLSGLTLGLYQGTLIIIGSIFCFKLVYNFLPSYTYRIINDEIYIEREFGKNYSNVYQFKIKDITVFEKKEKKYIKTWNKFYHLKNDQAIYLILTDDREILIKPDKKFIEMLNKKIELLETTDD